MMMIMEVRLIMTKVCVMLKIVITSVITNDVEDVRISNNNGNGNSISIGNSTYSKTGILTKKCS